MPLKSSCKYKDLELLEGTSVGFWPSGKVSWFFDSDGIVQEEASFYYTKESKEITDHIKLLKYLNRLDPKEL